jgi:hypothetical protein
MPEEKISISYGEKWTFAGGYPNAPDYIEWLASHPRDYVIISPLGEPSNRPPVTMHHATCQRLLAAPESEEGLGDIWQRHCGSREVLEEQFRRSEIRLCPACFTSGG